MRERLRHPVPLATLLLVGLGIALVAVFTLGDSNPTPAGSQIRVRHVKARTQLDFDAGSTTISYEFWIDDEADRSRTELRDADGTIRCSPPSHLLRRAAGLHHPVRRGHLQRHRVRDPRSATGH